MPTAPRVDRPLVGILLVVCAVFAFALADVTTKYLTERHPVAVVAAVRYLVNLLLLLVFLWPKMRSRLWATNRTGLVILRALCLAFASLTLGHALRLMPVGETVAIMYIYPFAVMILAIPLLGERVRLMGWIGAAVGFAGVLLILRPGGGLDPLGVTFALINAALATAYALLSRFLSRTETTLAMLFYVAVVGTVFFWVLAIPEMTGPMITGFDLALTALLGALAAIGHYLFTAASREAPASMLAPINYLHLVWAGGLGWLVFGHVPAGLSLVGMAMVAGAGVAVALSAHLARRAAARA